MNLFITGMGRSGTTLIEKLLHNHERVSISSQPFPLIYILYKQKYLLSKNEEQAYPLGNYFLEGEKLQDFYRYLDHMVVPKNEIEEVFEKMVGYSGQSSVEIKSIRPGEFIQSGTFLQLYENLLSIISHVYPKSGAAVYGSKEIYCEEYLPYILDHVPTAKGVIIVRDPRDVITSYNFGKGSTYVGDLRPVLFNLRNWRKSVAFALYLENRHDFLLVKYEDLVLNLWDELNRICEFLHIAPFPQDAFSKGILDQQGKVWRGNSSFDAKKGVSNDSIHKFKTMLPDDVIRYIEACCYAEMKYLGYDLFRLSEFGRTHIEDFVEPFTITKEGFDQNYSHTPRHIEEEIMRYELLQQSIDPATQQKWFIFPETYRKLREAVMQ